MIGTLMELARMKVSAIFDEKQVQELAKEIQLLEARAAPARVVDERHILCPACNQVRGCVHLVAELEQLRAEARRFYRADGSFEELDQEEVVRRRKAAAAELANLRRHFSTDQAARELDRRAAQIRDLESVVRRLRGTLAER